MRNPLQRLYTDRFSAYRQTEEADGAFTRQGERAVYEDVPCRLSRMTGLSGSRSTALPGELADVAVTRDAFVLFTHRRYVLRANDRVEIWRDGRKYEGRSADSMTYPTHAQTAVSVRKVVTNS